MGCIKQKTITAVSASLFITIPDISISGHKVQGFGGDDAFTFEPVDTAETYLGVDGKLNAGYIPQLKNMSLLLAPTSDAIQIFNNLFFTQEQQSELSFITQGDINIPALGLKYRMTNGVLRNYTPVVGVKKTLQPLSAKITWSTVEPA